MRAELNKLFKYPIDLKFENIYCPLILSAKKKYVGMKYVNLKAQPILESKGIELVRRDGCPI